MLGPWLVRKFIANHADVACSGVRRRYGVLEGWVSIVLNLAVFAAKIVPGLLIGSISLIADAFHSLGDVASSIVVIAGFHMASKPSDREHPFGHGRFESVASLVVALMLFLTAWEFGKASVLRLLHPRPIEAPLWLLALLAVTLVAKEWLARFSRSLGRRIGSSMLIGDFWHHRSDVLATAVVIAALAGARLGAPWVDGVGGLVVCAFVAWAALELLRESVNPLIGEAPSPQILQEMRAVALSIPGVDEVHDIVIHRYGSLAVASLHVEVSTDLDITRGHEIAEAVETKLNQRFGGWSVVHVDPVNRHHPLYAPVKEVVAAALAGQPGSPSFHDLRIVGTEDPCYVIFDLKTEGEVPPELVRALREKVSSHFPSVAKVQVIVEPRYVY